MLVVASCEVVACGAGIAIVGPHSSTISSCGGLFSIAAIVVDVMSEPSDGAAMVNILA